MLLSTSDEIFTDLKFENYGGARIRNHSCTKHPANLLKNEITRINQRDKILLPLYKIGN